MGKLFSPSGKTPNPPNRFMVDDDALILASDQKGSSRPLSSDTTMETKPDYGCDPEDSYVLSGRRAAPAGKFRVLGVDTFSGPCADFLVGDFVSKDDAIREATKRAGSMTGMHVYDDAGEHVFSAAK
jgi:hypothetical protein